MEHLWAKVKQEGQKEVYSVFWGESKVFLVKCGTLDGNEQEKGIPRGAGGAGMEEVGTEHLMGVRRVVYSPGGEEMPRSSVTAITKNPLWDVPLQY